MSEVQTPAVPNFPLPTPEYTQLSIIKLENVLRLYLNQLSNVVQITANQIPTNLVFTVGALPSAATAGVGARAFVTDSSVTTFGTTVASGGTNKVPVYSDGTDWKVG